MYWVDFDPARGGEIKKRRPAVVVSNDAANRYANRVQVIPLSSNVERIHRWEALVQVSGKPAKVLADQIRTASKQRLIESFGAVSGPEMLAVEQAIRVQLGLP